MKVTYIRGTPGVCRSNVLWPGRWPMRGGRFPKAHPCGANPAPFTFGAVEATPDPLGRFRGRGYGKASCFPEGDGITFDVPEERSDEQVLKDIADCFGWEVVQKGGGR